MRQPHRLPRPLPRRRRLHALIEHHRNIRPQRNLHIHRVLRRKEMLTPIQMRPKLHPLRRNLPQLAQAEHLKPTRVRQHRPLPAHKPMHPTHPPHQLMPRPQIQVIRIRQNDLRPLPPAPAPPATLRHRLHRRRRPHRHKHRSLHHPMRQPQPPPASATLRYLLHSKRKSHSFNCMSLSNRLSARCKSEPSGSFTPY